MIIKAVSNRYLWVLFLLLFGLFTLPGIASAASDWDFKYLNKWGSFCDMPTGNGCVDPDGVGGPLVSGDGQFNMPDSIAINLDETSGLTHIYVLDRLNNRVQVFDENGTLLDKWGSKGAALGQMFDPRDIYYDQFTDRVFIADTGNRRVQSCDPDGTGCVSEIDYGAFYSFFFVEKQGDVTAATEATVEYFARFEPRGIAVDEYGRQFVADTGNGLVFRMDSLYWLKASGGTPVEVALDHKGRVYYSDVSNETVNICDPSLNGCRTWGGLGTTPGKTEFPRELSIDNAGRVYVADSMNHRAQVFDSDTTQLAAFGSLGSLNGQFTSPQGIAYLPIQKVAVADSLNHRIQIFSVGSISLKGGSAFTASRTVAVSYFAPEAVKARFKETSTDAWSSWLDLDTDLSFVLTAGDGLKTVEAQFQGFDGRTSPTLSDSITLETLPPTAIIATSGTALPAGASAVFNASWSGSDAGSGVANYDVQYKAGTAGTWQSWLSQTTARVKSFSGQIGKTYWFRSRARDKAGNLSGWASPAAAVSSNDDNAFFYTGAWWQGKDSKYYRGSFRSSKKTDSKAIAKFYGDSAALITAKGPSMGKARVYVDGAYLKTIDFYSTSVSTKVTMHIKTWNSAGNHEIKLIVSGTKNASSSGTWVDIDGIKIRR